ncbi:PRMT5-domain-containing protein [Phellopilus nigrolimitatus]|nr:PRMT5-domain-containing protein [Phellopilus nigrolimitatus]
MDATWANCSPVTRLITQDEISKASQDDLTNFPSPIFKLKADGRRHFDGVALPITNEKWKERWRSMCVTQANIDPEGLEADDDEKVRKERELEERAERWRAAPSFLRDECNLIGLDEAENVIGIASDWLELDSPDDWLRHDCETALKQELAYASYLGLSTIIVPPPLDRTHAAAYGRALRACLEGALYMQITVRLPLYEPSVLEAARKAPLIMAPPSPILQPPSPGAGLGAGSVFASPVRGGTLRPPTGELNGTWEAWDTIRGICGYNPRLTLALDLTLPLPSEQGILSRWSAEPVTHILLPASTFIPNAKGYPVLPKGTQAFLQTMMQSHPTLVLSGTGAHLHSRGTEDKYVDYLRYLEKSAPYARRAQEANTLENYAQGYQDFLQMPLQPLQDHLASMVYENFERDPVKYQKYEEAILKALSDLSAEERLVLTVAGAGRGPLVARSLKAVERSSRNVAIYAIEKNPNAYVTLQQRQQMEWNDKVTVLFGDMRHLEVPEKADILVSELLGSFGDNELSPECLDGAMRFLKDDGISIPSTYAAYLAPIQSSKIHHEAGGSKDAKEKDREKGLETPYVVMLQAINFLSSDAPGAIHGRRCGGRIQQCWEFEHPRKDAVLDARGLPITNSHNTRSTTLTFAIPYAGVLHGFAGYFEAVLYGTIGLSIHPDRKDAISKDMLSWFPCFFPIKEPLYLPSNAELRVSLWRLTDATKVWYEWHAEAFLPLSIPSNPFFSSFPPSQPHLSGSAAPPSPRVNGAGSLVATSSTLPASPLPARSPLIDAIDLSFGTERSGTPELVLQRDDQDHTSVVKIGQTSLHNPGGRSSWYGL